MSTSSGYEQNHLGNRLVSHFPKNSITNTCLAEPDARKYSLNRSAWKQVKGPQQNRSQYEASAPTLPWAGHPTNRLPTQARHQEVLHIATHEPLAMLIPRGDCALDEWPLVSQWGNEILLTSSPHSFLDTENLGSPLRSHPNQKGVGKVNTWWSQRNCFAQRRIEF